MEATMLRSLPVITGRPLSFGLRDCSQEAKKASASIWMTARGNELMVSGLSAISILADDRPHHGGDAQFVLRRDRPEFVVGRLEPDLAATLAVILHGPVAVHLGNDDVAVLLLDAALHQHHVAGHDAGVDHRLALHLE